jgi:hypothetical protein
MRAELLKREAMIQSATDLSLLDTPNFADHIDDVVPDSLSPNLAV